MLTDRFVLRSREKTSVSRNLAAVLDAHGVDFHESGRNEILTRCPMCGASDPGHHLSISTRNRGWRCLRNPRMHRGRSYARLLTLLLHCSIERARELAGEENARPLPSREEHAKSWRTQLRVAPPKVERPRRLQFPREFRPLTWDAPRSKGFWDYLLRPLSEKGRGFTAEQARWAARTYNLQYALSGMYSYRVIIPVYNAFGELATWTARSIAPEASVRYMTLKSDDAVAPPGELLLGLQTLFTASPAKCLVATEGPFDAISISALGHAQGVWGTCLFGLELSEAQADLLSELEDRFERCCIVLDPKEAPFRLLGMRSRISRRWRSTDLPPGLKDPGELVGKAVGRQFITSLVS